MGAVSALTSWDYQTQPPLAGVTKSINKKHSKKANNKLSYKTTNAAAAATTNTESGTTNELPSSLKKPQLAATMSQTQLTT